MERCGRPALAAQTGNMDYEQTELYFLKRDLLTRFGEEEGAKIFAGASKLYTELYVTTDYRGSKTLETQMKRLVLPVIALYKTLCMHGYRKASALGLMRTLTERAAQNTADILAAQMRKITPFRAFRRNIRNFMEYKFPSAGGWQCGGLETDGRNISFRIEECLYRSISARFGCAELCAVFCDYERIAFAGLLPKIEFSCGGRLSEGHDFCSFSFKKAVKQKSGAKKK